MRHMPLYLVLSTLLLLAAACDLAAPAPTPTQPAPPPTAPTTAVTVGTPQALPTTAAGEPIVARVNDVPILKRDLDRQVAAARSLVQAQGVDPNSDKGREMLQGIEGRALDDLIDQEIVSQAAQHEGISVSEVELQSKAAEVVAQQGGQAAFQATLEQSGSTYDDFLRDLRAQLIWQKMVEKIGQTVPDRAEQVHVRYILLDDAATAQEVLRRLRAGQDFATVARQFSLDARTRDQGGDMGWMPRGLLPSSVETAAFSLRLRQFSDPVQAPLGYYIVQVLGKEANRPIDPELLEGLRQDAFARWLVDERARAQIERYLIL